MYKFTLPQNTLLNCKIIQMSGNFPYFWKEEKVGCHHFAYLCQKAPQLVVSPNKIHQRQNHTQPATKKIH